MSTKKETAKTYTRKAATSKEETKKKQGWGKKDLSDYAEVKDRIRIFYVRYPDGRIMSKLLKWENGLIVMQARAYRNGEDQKADIPCGVGHAHELEFGDGFELEKCETSAVGRALANAGIAIDKAVASRQEIEFAMERLDRMRQDGTFHLPAVVRRSYGVLLKKGQEKKLDHEFLFRLTNFVSGGNQWTEESIERAIGVVELYDVNNTGPAKKKLQEIAQQLAMEEVVPELPEDSKAAE